MKAQSLSSSRKVNALMLCIAAAVLTVLVGLSYRQWAEFRLANAQAERSRAILTAIDNVEAALVDAETGQRGFLLTGENGYLDPYHKALQELPGDLATLKRLFSGNGKGMQDFNELDALAQQNMAELRRTIEARRTQGPQAALAIVAANEGNQEMESIRTLCAQMRSRESADQERASADGETAAGFELLIAVAGALVLLFLFAFGLEPFASPAPRAWQRAWLVRYGAAVLVVAAITLIRAGLTPLMGPTAMPFTLYFCAVAFAAWFGGFRPAVLSIVLSLLAGAWFFAAPTGTFYVKGHDDQTAMLMIVLVGFGIALLSRSQWNAVERAMRAETSERAERQRLGLALTAGKMGAFEVDPVKKSFWWSPEAYSLFGLSPAEFKPTRDSLAALIHPGDRASFMQYWDDRVAVSKPANREFRILKVDGKERWISCIGTPSYDEAGSPKSYSGLFLDVSERREAEQVLRNFEKLSAAARLSTAMAHEINNPLGAVSNLLFLAKHTSGVPNSAVELLDLAEQELERVAHTARQALGFYRESSRAGAIDIARLIDSVLKIYSAKITEKKITIVRRFLKCAPALGVHGEIRQVVSNLLTNAIEAVNEGGTISITVQSAPTGAARNVEITVADDGCGIAAENLDRIFEPFFTTKTGTGTGLGLWVAKEIVERHQGSIAVRPTNSEGDGRGATFIVALPVEPASSAASQTIEPGKSPERIEQDGAKITAADEPANWIAETTDPITTQD